MVFCLINCLLTIKVREDDNRSSSGTFTAEVIFGLHCSTIASMVCDDGSEFEL